MVERSGRPKRVLCLDEVEVSSRVKVVHVRGRGHARRRLLAVGMVPGTVVEVIRRAPLYDPVEYRVKGTNFSIRATEAHLVEVELLEE